MNPKQERFVTEYLVDLNATQAAKRAGYSEDTAYSQGQRLLKHPEISHALGQAIAARSERTRVDADWVVRNLVEVAERCLQQKPVMVWDREERRMVQDTDAGGNGLWMFDSQGANRALELLGKHNRMFIDRSEVTSNLVVSFGGEDGLVDESA